MEKDIIYRDSFTTTWNNSNQSSIRQKIKSAACHADVSKEPFQTGLLGLRVAAQSTPPNIDATWLPNSDTTVDGKKTQGQPPFGCIPNPCE